jgi:hypothetical protein
MESSELGPLRATAKKSGKSAGLRIGYKRRPDFVARTHKF